MGNFTAETKAGETQVPVQLGMCLGGLIATWSPLDPKPQLWSVLDDGLPELLYEGRISKVGRGLEFPTRFREAAMLDTKRHTLSIEVDGEEEPRVFRLSEPRDISPKQTWFDLGRAISKALRYTAKNQNGILLLEYGGLNAPYEPFALFTTEGNAAFGGEAIVETRPFPLGSKGWSHFVKHGQNGGLVKAPLNDETLQQAGILLVEAARTWNCSPWDLALTFGTR